MRLTVLYVGKLRTMNGERTRRSGLGNESADDVDQTSTELDPMCSPHQTNSTDGHCRSAADQPTDDNDDVAAEQGGKWETIGDILERFAGDTSLLGVPRAILAASKLSRLFWVVVCVSCMLAFIIGCSEQMMIYFSYPKQVRRRSNM